MFKNVIRFLAVVAIQTILETVASVIIVYGFGKVVAYFMREDEIVKTDESTDSAEA